MEIERVQLKYGGPETLRLDRFLSAELKDYSRSHLQRIIAEGCVAVDGRQAKPSRILRGGETIEVRLPPLSRLEAEPEPIQLSVLFEDDHLIAVDKPAGMVVHPAPGHPRGTLVNALLAHCDNLSGIGGILRPGIVHRLDIGTSGVIVVAKSNAAHLGLTEQFKARVVEKAYRAVVFGRPEPDEGEVNLPIGRDRKNRKKISPATDRPREALTMYSVKEDFSEASYLELYLSTGRTHQVRVHMSHIGHPLVGDSLYGASRWRSVRDARVRSLVRSFGRPALHAYSLRFRHPVSGDSMALRASLPFDFTCLLEGLRGQG